MSTITTGTSVGGGLLHDSDTTGNLVIKTGVSAATTATFHSNLATTFAGNIHVNSISTPIRPLVSGTANTSISGTLVNFPSIPSWAKRVTVLLGNCSTSGGSQWQLRLGTSSGIESTGYTGGLQYLTGDYPGAVGIYKHTAGLGFAGPASAAGVLNGRVIIENLTGNTWIMTGQLSDEIGRGWYSNSQKILAGVLDRVQVTTVNGTDLFDLGTINIMWE
jgi:hypothetical protein